MILVIDNYDSFTYNLVQYMKQLGEVLVYRNDQILTSEIERLNPIIFYSPPGPGNPNDSGICLEVIQYFRRDVPIIGI